MKYLRYIFPVLLFMAVACRGGHDAGLPEVTDTLPLMIQQIRQCSKLYTAEYRVHKIVTHSDNVQLDGRLLHKDFNVDIPLGDRRVAIPIDATIKAYIDFSNFDESSVVRNGEDIEIILPDPRIVLTSTRIDHAAIRQYVPMLRSNFSDEELAAYERQGLQAIINDIAHMGIIETSRHSAAATLIPMLEQLGYGEEHITVTYRRHFGLRDIKMLVKE